METTKLRRFAQYARRSLMDQVGAKLIQVRATDSAARRESPQAVAELEQEIAKTSIDLIIDKVAYTWFNRFCALRFMDLNGYTRIRVVSPADLSQFQPEILAEAKMGHMDDERVSEKTRKHVTALLSGNAPSRDPQQEAYRLLIVSECNSFNHAMPYLFERIADYTELLIPDDLLSGNSILAYTREAMTQDACQDVEVIGWLYQFYISEKKDQVFEGLKKGKKISAENIPAATQLFTPDWIVRYLVENSLGRLWLLNRPGSKLAEQMDYYIRPEQSETDFLKIASPIEIKICDPACGSGHMLTYAFDLLYAIYEEDGYEPSEITEKILTHNLYGIEIDERAGELAAFALTMKARAKQRRFFNKGIKPNICVLENVKFDADELAEYMAFIGRDLFTAPLQTTLRQFEEADNFGSLIRPDVTNVAEMLRTLEAKDVSGQLFLSETHKKALQALQQADYLSPKYHVVIANPPYMGSRNMGNRLSSWIKTNYPNSKIDSFAAFIERNLEMTNANGFVAMITMQSWMFLSSFENLRTQILMRNTIVSLAHFGARAFDSIGGEVVSTVAFVLGKKHQPDVSGTYLRLVDGDSESEKDVAIRSAVKVDGCDWLYRVRSSDFMQLPGYPIAYWVSGNVRRAFSTLPPLRSIGVPRQGNTTTNNARFVRAWYEVDTNKIGFQHETAKDFNGAGKKWAPYNKGGGSRKWYGQNESIVNWLDNGGEIKAIPHSVIANEKSYFSPGITWSTISSGTYGFRYFGNGFIFDNKGACLFIDGKENRQILAQMNSKVFKSLLADINPTVSLQPGDVAKFPISKLKQPLYDEVVTRSSQLVNLSSSDWDSYETSWDFISPPLLNPDYRQPTLKATYQKLRAHWREMMMEMQRLEEENNRIFIDAYGLQDELIPKVLLNEITLTCNPYYRYGGDKQEDELEVLLLADTMRELVSYAVGCMFGRYSLDKPGLILANQGETLSDYLRQVPEPSFPADDDNVIPMLDGDWFTDDIAERFRTFLRVAFGEAHYEENVQFIETALGKNGKARDIRDYLLKDFYTDHVKRYKKRPIYWLFISPKGSFSALIYLHRYRPDTASVVLRYLREFRTKLMARRAYLDQVSISSSASQAEKTKALKEIDALKNQVLELADYERDTLFPLASAQVPLDLDDGVKVNYLKLGPALKKIIGLDAKEDE